MIDNTRYCIEWASEYMVENHPKAAWTKYSGPYSSLRRAMQAKDDVFGVPYNSGWLYRIVHHHKGR
jgi:hypothetical protein